MLDALLYTSAGACTGSGQAACGSLGTPADKRIFSIRARLAQKAPGPLAGVVEALSSHALIAI